MKATRIYVATAQALDAEMRARISAHRRQRGRGWRTHEALPDLVDTIKARATPGCFVLVANEVGLGIVHDNALARAFRNHASRLNQAIAAAAERVVLVAAGLPLVLKDPAP